MDVSNTRLPEHAQLIYLEYKRRQKAMVVWLINNSGYPDAAQIRRRYAPNYRLPIFEVEKLANAVVARRVVIPEFMLYVCRTMVKLRREVACYYPEDDGGHEWCTQRYDCVTRKLELLPTPAALLSNFGTVSSVIHTRGSQNPYGILSAKERLASSGTEMPPRIHNTNVESSEPKLSTKPTQEESTQGSISINVAATVVQQFAASIWSARVCDGARNGKLPFIVANYMSERALICACTSWSRLTALCQTNHLVGGAKYNVEDIVPGLASLLESEIHSPANALQRTHDQLSGRAATIPLYRIDFEEPFELLQALTPFHRMVDYANELPDPRYTDGWATYILQVLQDVEHDEYKRRVHMQQGDLSGPPWPQHSRLSMIIAPIIIRKVSTWQKLAMSHGAAMLRRAAQSFRYGFNLTYSGLRLPKQEFDINKDNYRLKALIFVQEVRQAFGDFLLSATAALISTKTEINLMLLKAELEGYLKHNRFDLLNQHPLFAGSDMMFVMDIAYCLGMRVLTYRVTFLGTSHVYNELRQLNILENKIPALEALRDTFLDTAFFGKLPNSKLLKSWEMFDDPLHTEQISAYEYRSAKNPLRNIIDSFDLMKETVMENFETTNRGQMLMKEGRLGCNQRVQAESFSLFHQIYNQKDDFRDPMNDETIADLLMKRNYETKWTKRGSAKCLGLPDGFCSRSFEQFAYSDKPTDGLEWRLAVIQDALVEEFAQPFPLITAKLLQIWLCCDKILSKMIQQGNFLKYDIPDPDRACVKRCLKSCDRLVQEQKENGIRYTPINGWNVNVEKLAKDGILLSWKAAFREHFGGTTLADFQWKNIS